MFCSNCGKEIRDNSNFCPYCGVVKRAIPSETVKQTPVQDTSASTKKNGSKAFKFCSNCGKVIGQNSDFCPYCGSAERAIPSKTVEQTPVQNTSVTAWQSRFKDFWRRKWSEDKQVVVVSTLLVLSIVCILIYGYIKNRYQEAIIANLVHFSGAYVGDEIYVEGWAMRSKEDGFFFVYDTLSSDSDWVIVDGRALEEIPERGTVVVRGEWVEGGDGYWLEADKVGFVDYEDLLYRYEKVDVADLILYPDTYMGKCVRVSGEVLGTAQGAFMVGERGSVSGVWVVDDENRFINGEKVTVYGAAVINDGSADIKLVRQYAMPGEVYHDTKIRVGG